MYYSLDSAMMLKIVNGVKCVLCVALSFDITFQYNNLYKYIFIILAGFNIVFPMEKLGAFSPEEVRLMLCGDQNPTWTKEDILAFTEPKLGFTRDRFVQ